MPHPPPLPPCPACGHHQWNRLLFEDDSRRCEECGAYLKLDPPKEESPQPPK